MTLEEEFKFLCEPVPGDRKILSWNDWIEKALEIRPETCLDILEEPEPFFTSAHKSAIMTLQTLDWDVSTSTIDGRKYFQYSRPDSKDWTLIPSPKPHQFSIVTEEIVRRLLNGHEVFVRWENRKNIYPAKPLWSANSLRLVPAGFRKFNRFWRGECNFSWMKYGPADDNCSIDNLNPDVHLEIFQGEVPAIDFVTDHLIFCQQKLMTDGL